MPNLNLGTDTKTGNAQAGAAAGYTAAQATNNGGVNIAPLLQNLLNYKSNGTKLDKAFDLQKSYSPDGRALLTSTANGTNYEYPIGPVQPGNQTTNNTTNNKNPSLAYDPADVAIAQANGAANSTKNASGNPLLNLFNVIGNGIDTAKNGLNDLMSNTTPSNSPEQQAFLAELGDPSSWSGLMPSANKGSTSSPGSVVDGDGSANSNAGNTGATNNGGTSGGGYGGGNGGGYNGNAAALLGQLGGTGLTGIGGGGTGTPYVPITGAAGTNSAEAAAAYAQLLKNAGYDLSQPLSEIPLPNRVDLPNQVELPENFDFLNAWNNLPEVNVGRINHIDTHPEEEMLGQITDLQSQQAILNANNTVNNGITELQRVMQNAQNQYQTQRDQIAMDERRALDNQALYNEARGDRGGIGAEQYNTIQNTAATNRLTVQKEQTQLATDTARQIADLRAQEKKKKANQLLNISQKYLSELMDLYQWAKETNLGVDEFNLQVEQWEENFKLSLVGAELDADAFNLNLANARIDQENNLFNARFNQENAIFDAMLNAVKLRDDQALARLNAQLNAANATGAFENGTPTYTAIQDAIANQLKERSMLADIGTALIKAGIQPSEQILSAMGMGGMATGTATTGLAGTPFAGMDATSVLRAMGIGNAGLAGIAALGYTPETFLAQAMGYSTTAGLPALGSGTSTGVMPAGGSEIYNQLTEYPNQQSEVAAYTQTPTPTSTALTQNPGVYTDSNVYAAFGADPETVLRAMGIGNDGMAGLAMLGVTPAQFIGQAFGL